MDLAATQHQAVFRHKREREEDSNLDCGLHLRDDRIAKKCLHLLSSLHDILKILSLTLFETNPINHLLMPTEPDKYLGFEPQQLSHTKNVRIKLINYGL